MMSTFMIYGTVAGCLVGLIAYVRSRFTMPATVKARVENQIRSSEQERLQAQIAALESADLKDTEAYQKSKEAYDAKYKRSSSSTGASGSSGTGSAS